MDALINISVIMLLFVAGMEVQLPLVVEQGKVALSTFFSMLIPICVGYLGVQFLQIYSWPVLKILVWWDSL